MKRVFLTTRNSLASMYNDAQIFSDSCSRSSENLFSDDFVSFGGNHDK